MKISAGSGSTSKSMTLLIATFAASQDPLAFECPKEARSGEGGEAYRTHLLRFQLGETSSRDQGSQLLQAAPPGVKARSPAHSFLLACEIGDDQATTRFKYPGDFCEPLAFEGSRQMMHHQRREHRIERLIGEGKLLDHPHLELDGSPLPSRFFAGTGDLLCPRVHARDAARAAHSACHFQRQRSRAAAYIQHRISDFEAGQADSPLPQFPQLATEREGFVIPFHEVVTPAP